MTRSVPSNLHLPRYSFSLCAADRMGHKHFRSYSVSSLYCLSTNIPLLRFFLLDSSQSASLLNVNLIEMGLPLEGLYQPILSVLTILMALALASFSSSFSPGAITDNSLSISMHLGSASSHLSSCRPVNTTTGFQHLVFDFS